MSTPPAALRGLRGDVVVHASPDDAATATAALLQRATVESRDDHGDFTIALTGGRTPALLHRRLIEPPLRDAVEWPIWRVYFGDERACPPDDENSNYHLARTTLLDHVPVDPKHVHRMPADHPDLDFAADEYAVLLHGDLPEGPDHAPRLDCILLGLGENGHVASLFPGTPALQARDRWVARGRADYAPYDRLTLTYPAINAAARVILLVTGASKAAALRATAAGDTPAAGVLPVDGSLTWMIDAAAAGAG